ncbi:DUF4258 domain-containing protein [Nitrospira sp. Nam80]
MNFRLSRHVREELEKRKIAEALIEQVLQSPEQKVPEVDNITCFQSKVTIDDRPYLLRVMVNETATPPIVVTAYRTKKINKYWRKP